MLDLHGVDVALLEDQPVMPGLVVVAVLAELGVDFQLEFLEVQPTPLEPPPSQVLLASRHELIQPLRVEGERVDLEDRGVPQLARGDHSREAPALVGQNEEGVGVLGTQTAQQHQAVVHRKACLQHLDHSRQGQREVAHLGAEFPEEDRRRVA